MTIFLEMGSVPGVIGIVVKVTLLLSLTAIVASVARRRSASFRHAVWAAAVVSIALLPVVNMLAPGWSVLPPWIADRTDVASNTVYTSVQSDSSAAVMPNAEAPLAVTPTHTASHNPNDTAEVSPTEPVPAFGVTPPSSDMSTEPMRSPTQAGVAKTRSILDYIGPGLAIIWLAGCSVSLLMLLVSWLQLRRLVQSAQTPIGTAIVSAASDAAAAMRVDRTIHILLGTAEAMPMTWGLYRANILLPSTALQWSHTQLDAVLRHELAHIKRWDCLTQLLARLVYALYWFHPLAWYAMSRLRSESERACDDLVLSAGTNNADYADHLLHTATGVRPAPLAGIIAQPMARQSALEGRLLAILDRSQVRGKVTRAGAAAIVVVLAVIVIPVAMLQAGEESATPAVVEEAGLQPAASAPGGDDATSTSDADATPSPDEPTQGETPVRALTMMRTAKPGSVTSAMDTEDLPRFALDLKSGRTTPLPPPTPSLGAEAQINAWSDKLDEGDLIVSRSMPPVLIPIRGARAIMMTVDPHWPLTTQRALERLDRFTPTSVYTGVDNRWANIEDVAARRASQAGTLIVVESAAKELYVVAVEHHYEEKQFRLDYLPFGESELDRKLDIPRSRPVSELTSERDNEMAELDTLLQALDQHRQDGRTDSHPVVQKLAEKITEKDLSITALNKLIQEKEDVVHAQLTQRAKVFISSLRSSQYQHAATLLNDDMRQAMAGDALAKFWTALTPRRDGRPTGEVLIEVEAWKHEVELGSPTLTMLLHWQRKVGVLKFTFDANGRISGFWELP